MATFIFRITSLSRGLGRSAITAAAYRAGERLFDERRGRAVNYSRRQDVLHREILLPTAAQAVAPDWSRDRGALWTAAEMAEKHRNARVAREYMISLPHELPSATRVELARAVARDIAEHHGNIVDLAVHLPREGGDPRNHHAHLLATTREITANGFGRKTAVELSSKHRKQLGLATNREECRALRVRFAELTNERFAAAGLEIRVDARSYAAQGIDRRPAPAFPIAVIHMERRGIRTEPMRRWQDELQRREARSRAVSPAELIEARRHEALQRWRLERTAARAPETASRSREALAELGRDDDFGLGD